MGYGSFNTQQYSQGVQQLRSTGASFARSATAANTRNYRNIADVLNPRKLNNGMRESCFATGFTDATAIAVSIDGTGSMGEIPGQLQKELPKLMELLTEQGVSDHPNVLFMCHDDERAIGPDAVFQISQFETEAPKLIEALNEMIIPCNGGGNRGEAYHLPIYAMANHTRLESFERDGTKGFFFIICDEEPYYEAGDPTKFGTSPEIAKEVFGDTIEAEVSMLTSLKKAAERFHIFVIRPGHTSHGRDQSITKRWQDLLRAAGENPEHVLEIPETEAIITTMAMAIGRLAGEDHDQMVSVLRTKGALGVDAAATATQAIVAKGSGSSTGSSGMALLDEEANGFEPDGRSRIR